MDFNFLNVGKEPENSSMENAIAISELKRIKIFIIALSVGALIMGCNFFVIEGTTDFFKKKDTALYVLGWFVLFIIYEVLSFIVAKKFLNRNTIIPSYLKLVNVSVESLLPGLLLFILCYREETIIFLDSPVLFFYFILIVLSALNLEIKQSLVVGVLSSGGYLFVTAWAIQNFDSDNTILYFPPGLYYARSIFMLLTALGGTFVAHEIKKRYKKSLAIKQERDDIERLFDQQVSKEVVDLLLSQDGFSSRRGFVSILFLDIRNYSSFAETKSPEEVISFQNNFFSPVLRIVNENHGVTNQIMGDGLMATFGAPIPDKNHAQNAYETALKILRKVADLVDQRIIPYTRIGIGIHSGEVVMGNIGNELRKQFSISGTAVVLAARIEQANKEHNSEFLISKDTYERTTPNGITIDSIGNMKLKNIETPVELFKVEHTT